MTVTAYWGEPVRRHPEAPAPIAPDPHRAARLAARRAELDDPAVSDESDDRVARLAERRAEHQQSTTPDVVALDDPAARLAARRSELTATSSSEET